MKKLSKQQERVYVFMLKRVATDVPILKMYAVAFYASVKDITLSTCLSNRDMQQRLGPIIKAINNKLDDAEIVPGNTKRTYTLRGRIRAGKTTSGS